MLVVGHGIKGYPDSYIRFEKLEDTKEYVAHSTTASARFKAKDFIDYQTSELELNGVSHNNRHNLTIETPSMIDFKNDDIIRDLKYHIDWRVTNVQIVDDGQMKECSMRPRKLTRLTLVR